MKNPFAKEYNTILITSIVLGALVAGAAAYLYLTENGTETRKKITGKVKNKIKDRAAGIVSKKTKLPKKAVRTVADHL